jgi:glycosyltransferase involved in cell wall biosynthesis
LPFTEPDDFKSSIGLEGKKVMLTSGLLSPNKGIEHVIRAMPKIVQRHPDSVYLVMGTTHPHVRRSKSEEYRESLVEFSQKLGVEEHVVFHDSFVDAEMFGTYMKAADIFITPYNSQGQIVSGVLSYALGAGKAIISTPYLYAEEVLRGGRGVLVDFGDSQAIAKLSIELLKRGQRWNLLRHAAYKAGRSMIWPRVADEYLSCFQHAQEHTLVSAA